MAQVRRRLSRDQRRQLIEAAATSVFAEHGYHRGSVDEIAARSGVTAPVVYDHFESKRDLHLHLVGAHYAALREVWLSHVTDPDGTVDVPSAVEAWFAYVEEHPEASRMLFTATNADPEVRESHRRVAADSRDLLLPLVARGLGLDPDTSSVEVEIAWEVLRSALQGLALWWLDRTDVPRRAVVDGAVRAVWHGLGTHSPPAGQLSATHATPLHPGDGGP